MRASALDLLQACTFRSTLHGSEGIGGSAGGYLNERERDLRSRGLVAPVLPKYRMSR